MADVRLQINRVLSLIETERFRPLKLTQLAECAGLSPCHFVRVFQGLVGETPSAYRTRQRLTDAAWTLRTGGKRILDVALDCGFSSQEAFHRAFCRQYGTPPAAYRRLWGTPPPRSVQPPGRVVPTLREFPLEPQLDTTGPLVLTGITTVLPGNADVATAFRALWMEFYHREIKPVLRAKDSLEAYSHRCPDPETGGFRYTIGWLDSSPVRRGWTRVEIPSSRWARFSGSSDKVPDLFQFAEQDWLARSGQGFHLNMQLESHAFGVLRRPYDHQIWLSLR